MKLLHGSELSETILVKLKDKITNQKIHPGLGIILVGNRSDSEVYVRMKKRACMKIGMRSIDIVLDETVTQAELIEHIENMNQDPRIHGILIQLPLPKHIDEKYTLSKISVEKDVDGFHAQNVGNLTLNCAQHNCTPCTPTGCIVMLEHFNIDIEGKHAVILGRSRIVGLPMSMLLLHKSATVTICHSKTKKIKDITRMADILVVACGKPEFITKEYIKDGCVVIDVGIHRIPWNNKKAYKLVGDVDFDSVKERAYAVTPVPGGIGPMTIAMLMKNTVDACERQELS